MNFNPESYANEQLENNTHKIEYRAYRNIPYVKNPVSPELQVLNIFIPQAYIDGGEINGFNAGGLPPVVLRNSKQLSHHAARYPPIHDFGYSPTAHFLTIPLDLGELRTELGSIKGVGKKRLDEIMAVIEKHLGIN